jgi:hypothetical protein
VDLADYVVWRKTRSSNVLWADGDGDGFVDDDDYRIWRANFGRTGDQQGTAIGPWGVGNGEWGVVK